MVPVGELKLVHEHDLAGLLYVLEDGKLEQELAVVNVPDVGLRLLDPH